MPVDGQLIGVILGFLSTVATVFGGVYVATRNRDTEKKSAAQITLEKTRDDAHAALLTLRDEQIKDLKEDLDRSRARITELEQRLRAGEGV